MPCATTLFALGVHSSEGAAPAAGPRCQHFLPLAPQAVTNWRTRLAVLAVAPEAWVCRDL
jgi:hypothetical protein